MNKSQLSSAALLLSLVGAFTVNALPTFISGADQSFTEQGGSQQMREILITEDASSPLIKEGYLDIHIPDEFPAIFDDERTESGILLYGAAVDDAKVEANPELIFTDGDRTLRIPILADFEAGDTLTISQLYLEGFYGYTATSSYLEFQINEEETLYYDGHKLDVNPSTQKDKYAPEEPTGTTLYNTSEGIHMSWTDPTDEDGWLVQIYRSESSPVGVGTPVGEIPFGEQSFLDTDVQAGQSYYYILRALDEDGNSSAFTDEISTVATLEEEVVAEEEDPDSTEDTPEEDPVEDTPEETNDDTPVSFTDELPSWAETAIQTMADAGIVEGNPDGSFEPNEDLNRAEAATLLWRTLKMGEPGEANDEPFDDVDPSDWYGMYVAGLSTLDLIDGNPDGTFEPEESINRAEFLQMAVNVYLYLNPEKEAEMDTLNETLGTVYSDVDSDVWYANTVDAASDWGFVEGSVCEEGRCFNPANEITRAEATQILYNIFADWVQQ